MKRFEVGKCYYAVRDMYHYRVRCIKRTPHTVVFERTKDGKQFRCYTRTWCGEECTMRASGVKEKGYDIYATAEAPESE